MIPLATIRELFDYNWWARDRQLEACAPLAPELFTRVVGGSFPSVRDTLAPLVDVEWLYLERWQGRSPTGLPPGAEYPTVEALRRRWAGVERAGRGGRGGAGGAPRPEARPSHSLERGA